MRAPAAFAQAALAASMAAIALSGCAGAARGPDGGREVAIEAEGWAPLAGDSLWSAKQRAVAEAQKKAVEKVVGVTVRASTRVDDAVSVRQSIEANMGGTIRRYDILSEGADDGFYKVRLKAVVFYRPRPQGTPRLKDVRVFVKVPDETAAARLRATLAAYDYPLSETAEGADVVVTGAVETYGRADPRLGGFHSYRVKLSLSVLEVRSGSVRDELFEGAAVDPDASAALDAALEQAAESSGTELASRLGDRPAPKPAPPAAQASVEPLAEPGAGP